MAGIELPDWLRGMALVGRDRDGILRTVRLDSEGRLSAFVVDSSDVWEDIVECGNAELAARLGSVVTYDRAGKAVFIEDFSRGLQHWGITLGGLGAAVAISPEYCCSAGYSCKLTAGEDDGQDAEILFSRGEFPLGRMGLAARFSLEDDIVRLDFDFELYDGVDVHNVKFRYIHTDNILQVTTTGGAMHEVVDLGWFEGAPYFFHSFKLVFDLDTDMYVRLRFDGTEYPIGDVPLFAVGFPLEARVLLRITCRGHEDLNEVAYVDNIVLTTAEP